MKDSPKKACGGGYKIDAMTFEIRQIYFFSDIFTALVDVVVVVVVVVVAWLTIFKITTVISLTDTFQSTMFYSMPCSF